MIGNRAPHMLRDAMHCIAPQHEGKVLLPISCQHDLTLRRRASAEKTVERMCEQLLANMVIENYSFELEDA